MTIYRFIVLNIFSCKILIISCIILIITVISNETTIESTIYAKLCRNVAIFYQQERASLFQVKEKFKACGSLKWGFSSSCFMTGDSHLKLISLHAVVFNENAILCFPNNVHLLKCFPINVKLLWFIQLHKPNRNADFQIFVSAG